jgi:branched-chain amino acid transport system substrate-binding protein
MKKIIALALALTLCLSAFAFAGAEDAITLKIAHIGPETGAAAVYGTATSRGAAIAAEEINAEDALTIELTEPETDEVIVEIDDGTVEDNDTAQIETEIILEDDATYND